MTIEELRGALAALPKRQSELERKITVAARSVVPVLKDAGRLHSAKELEELFFQLDALQQEINDLAESHGNEILMMLLTQKGGAK